MEKTKLKDLIILLERELCRLHYSEKTIQVHKKAWYRLVKVFNAKEESYFSLDLAMQYLNHGAGVGFCIVGIDYLFLAVVAICG